jgi:DNA-binding transcriptional regulator YbjK
MPSNPERRTRLADAAVRVLAAQGSRGLTHRAVDAEAGVPTGTSSNYFASREVLVEALLARIGERLQPDPTVHEELAARAPGRALFAAYLRDVLHRLTADRDAAICLFELRLEATRRPAVADALRAWRLAGLQADVEFNDRNGLPGGPDDLVLFHYALDGLVLDRLTVPIDEGADPDAVVDVLVERLLPAE